MTLRNLKSIAIFFCGFLSITSMSGANGGDLHQHTSVSRNNTASSSGGEVPAQLGDWIGVWYGANTSGRFDLALERAANGKYAGNISISADGGATTEFAVDLREVSIEGGMVTATFISPGTNPDIVTLTGSLGRQAGSGEWASRKNSDPATQVSESGTWQLQKHERAAAK